MRGVTVIPVLRAKLRPPATERHYVHRPRLLQLVDELAAAPLTLVVAPAGTGKTALLSDWGERTGAVTAWLLLDETDSHPVEFWSGVMAALETVIPGCAGRSQGLLRRRNGVQIAVAQLLIELDASSGPDVVLIIDDVHLVDSNEAIAESLAQFVQHLPNWLHVVLLSRRQPRLPLGRLRARGQLGELNYVELRFSHDEAVELVSRLLPSMKADQIEIVADRADGWAACIQLAAIVGRSERAQRAGGFPVVQAEIQVLDYVLHEVLGGEDPELVGVLMDVAVVDRVNPSLARALTRRVDAVDLLLKAEARGLFVHQLPHEGTFELHSLVRGALMSELGRLSPDRLADQHSRAAQWFQAADEVTLAVEHFLRAGQPQTALRVLAANEAGSNDARPEAPVRRAMAAIPYTVATADLEPMIDFAWCHLLINRRRFLELVDQAMWWGTTSGLDGPLQARLGLLVATAAAVSCDWAKSGELARQALADLGDAWWRDPLGRLGWNLVAREVALSERWDETLDEIRQADLALKRDPQRRAAFEGTRALGLALAGQPVDALRVAGGLQQAADEVKESIVRVEVRTAEAVSYLELGDRARAFRELQDLIETPAEPMFYVKVLSSAVMVAALLDCGSVEAARDRFEHVRNLVVAEPRAPGAWTWLARAGTQLALVSGDTDEAWNWAKMVDDGFWTGASAARVHLAEGNQAAAMAALDEATPRCARHEVVQALLRARAVRDRHDEAVKYTSIAVDLAVSHGMLQTVAAEGAELEELVEAVAWRAPAHWMDRFRRAARPAGATRLTSPADVVERLTEREVDIVRFLSSRLTVREIAQELYISQNTLKFHLKAIYRKLGVSSRADAGAAARRIMVAR
jgi:LuxR family transcriptional regulator, maltose regulon positive regulatory protein